MPATLTIEIRDDQVRRELARLVDATRDQSQPLAETAMILERAAYRNIEGRGRGLWEPGAEHLSIGYLMQLGNRREREGSNTDTARTDSPLNTLGYRQAISSSSDAREARAGSNHPWAHVHEQGATIPARTVRPVKAKALAFPDPATGGMIFAREVHIPETHLPARPIFAVTDAERALIIERFRRHNA